MEEKVFLEISQNSQENTGLKNTIKVHFIHFVIHFHLIHFIDHSPSHSRLRYLVIIFCLWKLGVSLDKVLI